jgi:hypothetical protein
VKLNLPKPSELVIKIGLRVVLGGYNFTLKLGWLPAAELVNISPLSVRCALAVAKKTNRNRIAPEWRKRLRCLIFFTSFKILFFRLVPHDAGDVATFC